MNLRVRLMKIANGIVFYTQNEVNEYLYKRKEKESRPILGLNNGIDVKPIKDFRKKFLKKKNMPGLKISTTILTKLNIPTLK